MNGLDEIAHGSSSLLSVHPIKELSVLNESDVQTGHAIFHIAISNS